MNKIKIIIAEDIDAIRENFCEIIKSQPDFELLTSAKCGRDIIPYAINYDFDIALLDIEMETPTDGIDAAKAILKVKPDAKIIFLTIHEDDDTVIKAMGTGAVDYVIKSDDGDKIISHIRRAYKNKVELEHLVSKLMQNEFVRLKRTEESLMYFIKNLSNLTPTEKEIIKYLLDGKKINEIANLRIVQVVTIKTQVGQLLKKFNVKRTKEITKIIKDMNLQSFFDEN